MLSNFFKENTSKVIWFVVISIAISVLIFFYRSFTDRLDRLSATHVDTAQLVTDINGKLSKPTSPTVVYVKGENIETKEISYVYKETDGKTGQKEKTDVQIDQAQKPIAVKINGKLFEVAGDVTETSKFENGKLVVTQTNKIGIDITAPEQARWRISVLRNAEKKYAGEVEYNMSRVTSVKVLAGQDMKPYIGLSFSVGDLTSKEKPKTKQN